MSQHHAPYPVDQLLHWAAIKPEAIWLIQPDCGDLHNYSWRQAADMVGRMATALKNKGWAPGTCVAIAGLNCAHWMLADLAIQMAGLTPVGLYPRQAAQSTTWILEHCEAAAIFLGPMADGKKFVAAVPDSVLKISLPYVTAPAGDTSWDKMCKGQLPIRSYKRPAPETLATLVYTSGTTGLPKGVMLSFGGLAFSASVFRDVIPARHQERLFSYMPLAHMLERVAVELASLYWGAEVYFLERSELLGEQLPAAAPTRLIVVPLVLARMQQRILARIEVSRLRQLVRMPVLGAVLRKRLLARMGLHNTHALFSGAAPVAPATLEFFHDVLGLDVLECYGQSEAIYCSINRPGMARRGSVGKPFADANLRLSAEAEIQVKHPGVMLGYYKDPEQTAAAFTTDGWLRTGDKGRFDDNGYLYITGRIKELLKTAKGKYVAPAPIEGALARNHDIDQLCLVGTHLTQPIMLVSLTAAAASKGRDVLEQELVADMELVNQDLEDHEKIAKLVVVPEPWSIESGFLTPTLKVRRSEIEQFYADAVAAAALHRDQLLTWL